MLSRIVLTVSLEPDNVISLFVLGVTSTDSEKTAIKFSRIAQLFRTLQA